jgi:hypothetical protein
MNENYQLKYIKYKTKYFNLCKDILNNSKHKTENYYNNKLNFNQIGGANINILFSCTAFNNASTLDTYFNLINDKINKFIPSGSIKTAISVSLYPSKIYEGSELVKKMKANHYNLKEPIENSLMDFIKLTIEPIDILVLSQCDDFVTVFMNNDFRKNIILSLKSMKDGGELVDFKKHFTVFKDNLLKVYNSLNGYIINIYYNQDIFTNVENSIAPVSILYILLHRMCCELFNILFIKEAEAGVYSKNTSIITYTDPDTHIKTEYEKACDEIYERNKLSFFEIITNKDTDEEKKYTQIIENYIPRYSNIMNEDSQGIVKIKQMVNFYLEKFKKNT